MQFREKYFYFLTVYFSTLLHFGGKYCICSFTPLHLSHSCNFIDEELAEMIKSAKKHR